MKTYGEDEKYNLKLLLAKAKRADEHLKERRANKHLKETSSGYNALLIQQLTLELLTAGKHIQTLEETIIPTLKEERQQTEQAFTDAATEITALKEQLAEQQAALEEEKTASKEKEAKLKREHKQELQQSYRPFHDAVCSRLKDVQRIRVLEKQLHAQQAAIEALEEENAALKAQQDASISEPKLSLSHVERYASDKTASSDKNQTPPPF